MTNEQGKTSIPVQDLNMRLTYEEPTTVVDRYNPMTDTDSNVATATPVATDTQLTDLETEFTKLRFKNGSLQLLLKAPYQDSTFWLDTGQHPNIRAWTESLANCSMFRVSGSREKFIRLNHSD